MKAECPNCGAVYQIDNSKIPDAGSYARCPKCNARFFIKKEFSSQLQLIHCPRCGRDVERSNFCSNCGFDFWDIKGNGKGKKDFIFELEKGILGLKKLGTYLLRPAVHILITGIIFLLLSGLIILTFLTIARLGAEPGVNSFLKHGIVPLFWGSIYLSWIFYDKYFKEDVNNFLDRKLGLNGN